MMTQPRAVKILRKKFDEIKDFVFDGDEEKKKEKGLYSFRNNRYRKHVYYR